MTLKNETVEVGGQLQMIEGKEVIELEPDEETSHQAANEEEICISRNEDDLANDPEVVALAMKKFYLDDRALLNLKQLKEADRRLKIGKARRKTKGIRQSRKTKLGHHLQKHLQESASENPTNLSNIPTNIGNENGRAPAKVRNDEPRSISSSVGTRRLTT